jgi:ketosteroid isomerase-like protein
MSEANVQIVRRVYEAAAKRDSTTVLALYDRNVELDNTRIFVGEAGGVYRGHEGLRSFFREFHEAWDNIDYDYDELIDAGNSQVVSVVTRHGRGRASGAEVEMPAALVWTVRDNKVIRVIWYRSRADALEAVGSSE